MSAEKTVLFKGLTGYCRQCEYWAVAKAEDNPGIELHAGWRECPNCGSPMWAIEDYEVSWPILPTRRRGALQRLIRESEDLGLYDGMEEA